MGFRISIKHNGISYGDDHKLYSYVPLKDLSSFNVILPEIKKQWDIPEEYSPDTIYGLYFCSSGHSDELILDAVTFSKFADAYLIDLEKVHCGKDLNAFDYMNKLKHLKGDKILYWG